MLKEMLEYQKEEQIKISLENEIANSEDRKVATLLQQTLKNQHSELISLENNAKKYNDMFNLAMKKYDEYMEKLSKLEEELGNADLEKHELYEKAYNDFVKTGESLEKSIKNIYIEVQKINKSYEDIILKSKKDRLTFDKHSKAYKLLKQDREPKIQACETKMEEFKKAIDEKILHIYNQKRESHIFPVFVPIVENKCGGCRMIISASNLGKMKNNEYNIIECENCARLIYQK